MLPTEQPEFFKRTARFLSAYGKFPSNQELEAWWEECRKLSLDAIDSALRSHREDPDRGERAPRPVDITRRMKAGSPERLKCAARDASAQCAFPGIFSDGTAGDGAWWCPLHRVERSGPEASRRIEYSHATAWEDFCVKRISKRAADTVRSPAVVSTARAIAKRHGNRPWQTGLADLLPRREEAA